jgi:hypothetical protein
VRIVILRISIVLLKDSSGSTARDGRVAAVLLR